MAATTRQGIALHGGERRRECGKARGGPMPLASRAQARCQTDHEDVSTGGSPAGQPRAITQPARTTTPSERFNPPWRQRMARLVREPRAFSTTLAKHSGALPYGLCHDNLTRRGA